MVQMYNKPYASILKRKVIDDFFFRTFVLLHNTYLGKQGNDSTCDSLMQSRSQKNSLKICVAEILHQNSGMLSLMHAWTSEARMNNYISQKIIDVITHVCDNIDQIVSEKGASGLC